MAKVLECELAPARMATSSKVMRCAQVARSGLVFASLEMSARDNTLFSVKAQSVLWDNWELTPTKRA